MVSQPRNSGAVRNKQLHSCVFREGEVIDVVPASAFWSCKKQEYQELMSIQELIQTGVSEWFIPLHLRLLHEYRLHEPIPEHLSDHATIVAVLRADLRGSFQAQLTTEVDIKGDILTSNPRRNYRRYFIFKSKEKLQEIFHVQIQGETTGDISSSNPRRNYRRYFIFKSKEKLQEIFHFQIPDCCKGCVGQATYRLFLSVMIGHIEVRYQRKFGKQFNQQVPPDSPHPMYVFLSIPLTLPVATIETGATMQSYWSKDSSPDRDSNLDLPVLSSRAQHDKRVSQLRHRGGY
uniref:Uncharacterized protein n=1 Tax=Timema cristinae TaxID=61476 RepID=A0A7R9D4B1_TIMCR|nr:unnamed protein product [Timema cristinae]